MSVIWLLSWLHWIGLYLLIDIILEIGIIVVTKRRKKCYPEQLDRILTSL